MNKTFIFCGDLELQRVNMFLNKGNANCVDPYIDSIILNIQN